VLPEQMIGRNGLLVEDVESGTGKLPALQGGDQRIQIDVAAASRRGVAVFNAPFSNTRSVVELALAEIIAMARRLPEKNTQMHEGRWDKSASGSHEMVSWDQIPDVMKNAQIAAEDATFMTNNGFDVTAILRTVWNRLSGGSGFGSRNRP